MIKLNNRKFSKLEALVLEALLTELPERARQTARDQIDCINKVQRFSSSKEVNLYRTSWGRISFDDDLRFARGAGEEKLATVQLENSLGSKISCDIYLAAGRIFSLIFDRPPDEFPIQSSEPPTLFVNVWFDPSTQGTAEIDTVSSIQALLPNDYMAYVSTGGRSVGKCAVLGPKQIRKVVTSTSAYYVIAEVADAGTLVIREGDLTPLIFLLEYDDVPPKPLSPLLREALELVCK